MNFKQAKKKLSGLRHYKGNEEKLNKDAEKLVKLTDKDLDVASMFIDKEEKKQAKSLLRKYLDDFSIENISDKNSLKQLIYCEIIQIRLQTILNELSKPGQSLPLQMLEALQKNSDKINDFKAKLNLVSEKQGKTSGFDAYQDFLKRIKIWCKNNPSRHRPCPHCGKQIKLIMRPDVWDASKHGFFPYDRVIGNKHLISLYKQNKLNKKDLALILEVSEDYIDWLVKKWENIKDE